MKQEFNRKEHNKQLKAFEANPDSEESQKWLQEEYERCKDPRYFYNTYWTVNGEHVKPISKKRWEDLERQKEEWLPMPVFIRRKVGL